MSGILGLGWELYAEKKICEGGHESKGKLGTVEACGNICKGVASMFIYAPAHDGYCYCETDAKDQGTCTTRERVNYNLYRYTGVYDTYYFHGYFRSTTTYVCVFIYHVIIIVTYKLPFSTIFM